MGGQPCRTCGLVNPHGLSFCQRCGQRLDPAVGTRAGSPRPPAAATASGGSTSGGGRRLAIVGVAAIFIATIAGAALVLSGVLTSNRGSGSAPLTTAGNTPRPTRTHRPARTAVPAATNEVTPQPSARARTPRPTKEPTPTPPSPSQAPPPAAYVCDADSSIADTLGQGWNIRRLDWRNMGKYDRLFVTLDQKGVGGNGTQAIVRVMLLADVPATLQVSSPQAGTTAVALGLLRDVRLTWSLDRALTLPALKWITMEKDDNGDPWIVLGVKGHGCYSLQVPDWSAADPQPATTVLVTVDVQH